MPNRITKDLNAGRRLPPSERRDLVRMIVDDCHKVGQPYPRTSQLRIATMEAVDKYPNSFKDMVDGQVVGTGFDSLLTQ